jgi:hypothetical protein
MHQLWRGQTTGPADTPATAARSTLDGSVAPAGGGGTHAWKAGAAWGRVVAGQAAGPCEEPTATLPPTGECRYRRPIPHLTPLALGPPAMLPRETNPGTPASDLSLLPGH